MLLYLLNEDFYRKFIFWYFVYEVFFKLLICFYIKYKGVEEK